ncbi:MAG: ABC transporter substrate-binding protein [Chloroflexi bacterium]|nr:ABC transporter substrate-binding protein [Chloroflexota bacterium]
MIGIDSINQNVTRRGFLRGAALGGVGLATAAVIGCDDDDDDDDAASAAPEAPAAPAASAPAGSAPAPEPAKSVKMTPAVVNPGNTLDPNTTAGSVEEFHGIYDTLMRLDADEDLITAFAQSREIDPNDNTRWIFHLRDAEFSDGVKVTAEDVKFSLEYYANPDNKSSLKSRVGTVDHVEVMDPLTAVVVTKKPDPILDRTQHLLFILPKHIFEDSSKGLDFQSTQAVGSGAYVPASYAQGSRIELMASPSSWRGTKGVDEVNIQVIKETSTRIAALETGDIDWTTGLPQTELERIDGFENIVLGENPVSQWVGWSMEYFQAPTEDVRVRLALHHALNNQAVVDAVYFGRARLQRGQPLTPRDFGFNPDLEPYAYDPDLARQMLADAGFPDGFDTTITSRVEGNPTFANHALAAADDISSIGINVTINNVETAVWRDGIYGRQPRTPHIFHMPFSASVLADASSAYTWLLKDSPSGYYDNPAFEAKFTEGQATMDPVARTQLYREATAELNADPLALWTVQPQFFHAWREDLFAKAAPSGQPGVFYDQVEPA